MASHGVPRIASSQDKTEDARRREHQKIQMQRDKHDYTDNALKKTSELLSENAEYYSIWNYRRRILQFQLENNTVDSGLGPSRLEREKSIEQLIQQELDFLVPLLRQFPKCYWIWNHRLWILEETIRRLTRPVARKFWKEELVLVGKMLSLDGRNFHGWGYRRKIVAVLESLGPETEDSGAEGEKSYLTEAELNYTTKMIGTNLSNFSAWHNRSKLILKMLNERSACDDERRKMLDDGKYRSLHSKKINANLFAELKLIHRALIDPYDQSLWFYHQNLMCTLDRTTASEGIAPNMSDETRIQYLTREIDAITELLDEEEDCKWIYQALIECSLIVWRIQGSISDEAKRSISKWLSNLKRLDPLRKGRWEDLEEIMNKL
ncbi:Rab geranylgeranyltransferase [Emydomyces testavorans]|uniref:Geranylgeranyl transferase type-2 subunit alpha n=1 Tax=Emydomyces testavorans TaxID=2070801 RepID=A0AAF0DL53_9EURO|nr:Rab geranylgeranyltransferase [Emydomyces testavorans]